MCVASSLFLGTQMIIVILVNSVKLSQMELAKRFKNLTLNKGVEREAKILFSKSLSLIEHQERVNGITGSVLVFICFYYLVTITLFSYACLVCIMSEITSVKGSMGLANGGFFHFYLQAFYSLCCEGQKLVDSQDEVAESIARLICAQKRTWSTNTKDFAVFVKEKYQRPKPLAPYSFFSLDRSGFLSTSDWQANG